MANYQREGSAQLFQNCYSGCVNSPWGWRSFLRIWPSVLGPPHFNWIKMYSKCEELFDLFANLITDSHLHCTQNEEIL